MVHQLPETDIVSNSRMQLLAQLDVCMGGRVAEEIIFGPDHVTTGAFSDTPPLAPLCLGSCVLM